MLLTMIRHSKSSARHNSPPPDATPAAPALPVSTRAYDLVAVAGGWKHLTRPAYANAIRARSAEAGALSTSKISGAVTPGSMTPRAFCISASTKVL